ncbi:MAG: hypothetical protein RLY14_2826 [Planctomycetota bacterium]|jgi:hypothetical protein
MFLYSILGSGGLRGIPRNKKSRHELYFMPGKYFGKSRNQERLEYVRDEVVTPVISAAGGVLVVPLAIVDRDLHFRWISVIQAIAASIVLISVEILGIVDVGVMIEAMVIASPGLSSRYSAVSVWILGIGLGASQRTKADRQKRSQQ